MVDKYLTRNISPQFLADTKLTNFDTKKVLVEDRFSNPLFKDDRVSMEKFCSEIAGYYKKENLFIDFFGNLMKCDFNEETSVLYYVAE